MPVELTKSNDIRMKIHAGLILMNASTLRLSEVQRETLYAYPVRNGLHLLCTLSLVQFNSW